MRRLFLYALALAGGLLVGLLLNGTAVWHLVAGPPDLGRADYTIAERPMNHAVACAADDDGCASPDIEAAPLPDAPKAVLDRLDAVATRRPRVTRVDDGSDPLHRRYVARSRWLGFPDTVAVDAVPLNGGTALRMSSRSQIGVDDFGVNEARLREWLAALAPGAER